MSVSNQKHLNKTPFPSFLCFLLSSADLFTSLAHSLTHLHSPYHCLHILGNNSHTLPPLWMEDILPTEEPLINVSSLDLVDLSFTQRILFILVTIKMVS